MSHSNKEGIFLNRFIFLLSPFLGVPIYLVNLVRGERRGFETIALIIALISYLYIPSFSNDKVRYMERYELFQGMDVRDFSWYLIETKRADFIFEYLLYFSSNLSLPLQVLIFCITFFTVFNIFRLVFRLADNYALTDRTYILFFFLCFFSLSYPAVFSGIRFMFATSILLSGLFLFFYADKKKKGLLLLIVAVCTHISLLIFVPVVFLLLIWKRLNYKVVLLLSLVFFAVPVELVRSLVTFINLGGGLDVKTSLYFAGEDIVSQGFDRTASVFAFHLKLVPVYVGTLYLLLRPSDFGDYTVKLAYLYTSCVNITFAFPTVYERFSLITKLFLVFILLYDFAVRRNKKFAYLFLLLFVISFLVEINQIRYNLIESLFQAQNLSLYGILTNKHSLNDIITF